MWYIKRQVKPLNLKMQILPHFTIIPSCRKTNTFPSSKGSVVRLQGDDEFCHMPKTLRLNAHHRRVFQDPNPNPVLKAKQHKTAITRQPPKPWLGLHAAIQPQLTQFYSLLPVKKEETQPAAKVVYFSDLTEEELSRIFSTVPPIRLEFCTGFLDYIDDIFDNIGLFGTIQAAVTHFSPDPLHNAFSVLFNRDSDNLVRVSSSGSHVLHKLPYCSLPLSSTTSVVLILAKLSVKVDKNEVDDPFFYDEDVVRESKECAKRIMKLCGISDDVPIESGAATSYDVPIESGDANSYDVATDLGGYLEADCTEPEPEPQDREYNDNEVFQVCDDYAIINLSEKPNGGSGKNTFKGRDGYLELYYVALKYAVDAHLEVEFVGPPLRKSRVCGMVRAYYGKNFGYDKPADDYHAVLLDLGYPAYLRPGKVNLTRSVLAVPAKFSLIIEADMTDCASSFQMSGTYEFSVPLDGSLSFGSITCEDFSLKLKVNWKLPFEQTKFPSLPIYPPASNSSASHLD